MGPMAVKMYPSHGVDFYMMHHQRWISIT